MFEKAARLKLRFNQHGNLSVEDLWDLPVEKLDSIYKNLNSQSKQAKEGSLLEEKNPENEIIDLKINIIKHVVAIKLQEYENNVKKVEGFWRKQKLLGILEEKQDEKLHDLSPDKLKEMIAELD